MHRKIVLHLTPMATPAEAMDATEEDWLRDTMGEDGLSKQRFIVSWFELADLWTESMEASEYEEFLIGLLDAIVVQHPDGMIEWKDDRDIIREHFKKRQEQGKKVTDTHNMPLCLSRWHKHLKNQAVQRAAALAADRIRAGLEGRHFAGRAGSGYSTPIAAAFAAGISASRRDSQASTEAGQSLRSSFGTPCVAEAPEDAPPAQRSRWRRHSMGAVPGRRTSFTDAVDAVCNLTGRARRASCSSCIHASDGSSRPSSAPFVEAFKPRSSAEGSGGPSLRSSFVDACYDHAVRGPTRTLSPNLVRYGRRCPSGPLPRPHTDCRHQRMLAGPAPRDACLACWQAASAASLKWHEAGLLALSKRQERDKKRRKFEKKAQRLAAAAEAVAATRERGAVIVQRAMRGKLARRGVILGGERVAELRAEGTSEHADCAAEAPGTPQPQALVRPAQLPACSAPTSSPEPEEARGAEHEAPARRDDGQPRGEAPAETDHLQIPSPPESELDDLPGAYLPGLLYPQALETPQRRRRHTEGHTRDMDRRIEWCATSYAIRAATSCFHAATLRTQAATSCFQAETPSVQAATLCVQGAAWRRRARPPAARVCLAHYQPRTQPAARARAAGRRAA